MKMNASMSTAASEPETENRIDSHKHTKAIIIDVFNVVEIE
jgi:hypothetical protein